MLIIATSVMLVITWETVYLHVLVTNLGGIHAWTVLLRTSRLIKAVRTTAAVSSVASLAISLGVVFSVLPLHESPSDAGLLALSAFLFLVTGWMHKDKDGRTRRAPR